MTEKIADLVADWRRRIDAIDIPDVTIARAAGINAAQLWKIMRLKVPNPQRTTIRAIEATISAFEAIPGLKREDA